MQTPGASQKSWFPAVGDFAFTAPGRGSLWATSGLDPDVKWKLTHMPTYCFLRKVNTNTRYKHTNTRAVICMCKAPQFNKSTQINVNVTLQKGGFPYPISSLPAEPVYLGFDCDSQMGMCQTLLLGFPLNQQKKQTTLNQQGTLKQLQDILGVAISPAVLVVF